MVCAYVGEGVRIGGRECVEKRDPWTRKEGNGG
jgi:hypothetical protein